MAAGRVSAPGTRFGPCGANTRDCEHRDCEELRKVAAASCRWCRGPIGFMPGNGIAEWDGRRGEFYSVANEFAHAACEEEAVEEERAGGHPEQA